MRVEAVAALAPLAQDVVVTGHDRDTIGLLVYVAPTVCRALAGVEADTPPDCVIAQAALRRAVGERLAAWAAATEHRVADRAWLLAEPPSLEAGEITDKGYINQHRARELHAAAIARLHADGAARDPVIVFAAASPSP
jgi:feruloyl-CoA synthase